MAEAIHQQSEAERNTNYGGRYKAYLKSDHWKATRNYMMKKYDGKCELCGSANNINIHHVSYENLGSETEEDLMCLCESCHGAIHSRGMFESYGGRDGIKETYKEYKKVYKKFNNEVYLYCLPLHFHSVWSIEQLADLWSETQEQATERINRYVKIKIVDIVKFGKNKTPFYYLQHTIFSFLSKDFPKLAELDLEN